MSALTTRIIVLIRDALDALYDIRSQDLETGVSLVDLLPENTRRRELVRRVIEDLYRPQRVHPSTAFVAGVVRRKSLSIQQLADLLATGHRAKTLLSDNRVRTVTRALRPDRSDERDGAALYYKFSLDPAAGDGSRPTTPDELRPVPRAMARNKFKSARPPVAAADEGFSLVNIFYATDRAKLTVKPGQVIDYGSKRADALQLGECQVSIPTRHKAGKVERPKWWKFEFAEDPEKHVTLRTVTELADQDFYDRVSKTVDESAKREAFVFVHGYNVKFADAARQTAQMAFDLKFDGAPILYSWPSQGTVPGYVVDATTVAWTEAHLIDFLTQVAARTGADRVHVIAHSMGNRAVCNALELLSQRAQVTPNLHHVVLTAPDVDADTFRNMVKVFKALPRTITLYASSKDKAIQVSKTVNGAPRAGEPIVIIPGIDSIDASAVETDFLAHGYFSGTRSVLSDIYNLLQDQPANSRFDLTPDQHADGGYYRFKP